MTSSEKFVLWLRSSFELPFDLGPCVPALAQCSNSICQTGVEVDLLTIDLQRLDEDILIAQVWPTYPTHIVALESHCRSLSERARLRVVDQLSGIGYVPVRQCAPTVVSQRRTPSSDSRKTAVNSARKNEQARPFCLA